VTTFAHRPLAHAQSAPWTADTRLVIRWNAVDPATRRPFTLEWSIRRDGDALRADGAVIESGVRRALHDFTDLPVRWTHDERLRLDHFDAPGRLDTDLPALNVSVDLTGAAPTLIFARTGALPALGLPGGRYEPNGASFVHN